MLGPAEPQERQHADRRDGLGRMGANTPGGSCVTGTPASSTTGIRSRGGRCGRGLGDCSRRRRAGEDAWRPRVCGSCCRRARRRSAPLPSFPVARDRDTVIDGGNTVGRTTCVAPRAEGEGLPTSTSAHRAGCGLERGYCLMIAARSRSWSVSTDLRRAGAGRGAILPRPDARGGTRAQSGAICTRGPAGAATSQISTTASSTA